MLEYPIEEIKSSGLKDDVRVKQYAKVTIQALEFKEEFVRAVRGNCTGVEILSSILCTICEENDYEIDLTSKTSKGSYIIDVNEYDELMDYVVGFEITNVEIETI